MSVVHVNITEAPLVPVSIGELLDKISILRIKFHRIKDNEKQVHIQRELDRLLSIVHDLKLYDLVREYIWEFGHLNTTIWDAEDKIRELVLDEKNIYFADGNQDIFRQCHETNYKRFALKDKVNKEFNSELQEQKNYDR